MKKIIALVLAVFCLVGMLSFNVGAELTWDDLFGGNDGFTETLVSEGLLEYFGYAEIYDGYFSEGELPSADTIVKYLSQYIMTDGSYKKYIISGQSTTTTKVYRIPSDVFEELLFSKFEYSDALRDLMRNSEYVTQDFKKDYKLSINKEEQIASNLVCEYYGFKMLDKNKCVAYAKVLDFGEMDEYGLFLPYEIRNGDRENLDYSYTKAFWLDVAIPEGAVQFGSMKFCSSFAPVKMCGYVKVVFDLDFTAIATICSYEKIENEAIPVDDEIVYDLPEYTPEEDAFVAYLFGAYIFHQEKDFGRDAVVSSSVLLEGKQYEAAISAVKGGKDSVVYDLEALLDGENVVPSDSIKVTFYAPFDLSQDIGLFMINEDGSVTQLEYKIDKSYDVLIAELPYLTTVVAARTYTIPEVIPEDTTTAETIPVETNAPETTAPETSVTETTATDVTSEIIDAVTENDAPDQTDSPEIEATEPESDLMETETDNSDVRPSSPQTGDSSMIVAVLAAVALIGCVAVILNRKRKMII